MPRTSRGQHVAGELNALKAAVEGAGQGLAERGLADAGNAFDQQMALGEDGDQCQAKDLVLAANDTCAGSFRVPPHGGKLLPELREPLKAILLCGVGMTEVTECHAKVKVVAGRVAVSPNRERCLV